MFPTYVVPMKHAAKCISVKEKMLSPDPSLRIVSLHKHPLQTLHFKFIPFKLALPFPSLSLISSHELLSPLTGIHRCAQVCVAGITQVLPSYSGLHTNICVLGVRHRCCLLCCVVQVWFAAACMILISVVWPWCRKRNKGLVNTLSLHCGIRLWICLGYQTLYIVDSQVLHW